MFAFDLEREREIAERTSGTKKSELLSARLRLIDEIMEYRRTGRSRPSLIAACDTELGLSNPFYSVGLRRLCELSADGHDDAKARVRALFQHPRGEVRAALFWGAGQLALGRQEMLVQARRLLKDRSRMVRNEVARTAASRHWFELARDIEEAALSAKSEPEARSLHFYDYHLRKNQRTGHRGSIICEVEDRPNEDRAQAEFLDAWRARRASESSPGSPRN